MNRPALPRARALRLAALLAAPLLVSPLAAQSDILLQLRSGSPAGDRFRIDSAGGLVAMGTLGIGIIPASGAGYRMMWYPFKAAFRAGGTDDGGAGDSWNDANVGFYSWAGGNLTRAGAFGTFAFGDQVVVTGVDGAAFGGSNTVSGTAGFATGASNNCSGFACVAMGFTNTASGQGSIAIGYRVTADANYAVALGHRASANGRTGSFTWADQSTTDSLENSANNSFQIRAAGGVRLYTNATTTVGASLNAGGSSWNVISDRARKENFLALDGEDVLLRLRAVPVSRWQYRDEENRSTWHIGPMAQDWHAAFALSDDPLTINQGDFDGVNLAAVKALEARTAAQAEQLVEQTARIRALEAEVERLRSLEATQARHSAELAEIRALLERGPGGG
jgi:trimeric autotransporter adhesin